MHFQKLKGPGGFVGFLVVGFFFPAADLGSDPCAIPECLLAPHKQSIGEDTGGFSVTESRDVLSIERLGQLQEDG